MVRKIQVELYRPVPGGLCGMDDYGNMEGWYAEAAIGYAVADNASGYYEIGNPLFPKVTVVVEGNKPGIFIVKATNESE
jgi:putative alpha-1,2-mannosidase